jgi:hypothetical protein
MSRTDIKNKKHNKIKQMNISNGKKKIGVDSNSNGGKTDAEAYCYRKKQSKGSPLSVSLSHA